MATQTLGTDSAVLLGYSSDISTNDFPGEEIGFHQEGVNVFRGFFFAMLVNLFLVLISAVAWDLWRHTF